MMVKMRKWWWRIALLAIGLTLLSCSLCLVVYSRLEMRREVEREPVPIEAPPVEPTPHSWNLDWGGAA
jgi:hypothetical protein